VLRGGVHAAAILKRGARLHDEAMGHFDRVNDCYGALLGTIATALVSTLSDQIDEVLDDYGRLKRKAAVLDFNDLLYRARDLVRMHENAHIALAQRYSTILVDEFQDTDAIQAEVLFRIAAADCPERWEDATLRSGALFIVGDPKQAIYRFRGADIEIYARSPCYSAPAAGQPASHHK
jgi:CRISPR-associated exonuclease Cas4